MPRRLNPLAILVIAIVGVALLGVALAVGVMQLGIPVSPGGNGPVEKLGLLNYTIGYDQNQLNPTVLSLWLKNDGVAYALLGNITIQDQGPNPASVATFQLNGTVGPGGAAAKVTLDTMGSGFYFVHGHSYYLTVQTLRGNRFSFQLSYL